jgi:hypothetical protein
MCAEQALTEAPMLKQLTRNYHACCHVWVSILAPMVRGGGFMVVLVYSTPSGLVFWAY